MTSHSSQGQTADRVLIHVDTEQAPGELVNSRMAYVSVSRAQFPEVIECVGDLASIQPVGRSFTRPARIQLD